MGRQRHRVTKIGSRGHREKSGYDQSDKLRYPHDGEYMQVTLRTMALHHRSGLGVELRAARLLSACALEHL